MTWLNSRQTGIGWDTGGGGAKRAHRVKVRPQHQVARAEELADARGGAAVDLPGLFPALAQLLLIEHRAHA